jgi:1-pyrroline-5-carboxylate dehydrogenase
VNEPVKSYCPGSPERAEIKAMLEKLQSMEVWIPMFIDGKEIKNR